MIDRIAISNGTEEEPRAGRHQCDSVTVVEAKLAAGPSWITPPVAGR